MGIIYGLCCCAVVSVVKPNSINMGASAKVICSLVTVTFFMYSASSLECLEWSGRDNNITRITCDVCAAEGSLENMAMIMMKVVFGGACFSDAMSKHMSCGEVTYDAEIIRSILDLTAEELHICCCYHDNCNDRRVAEHCVHARNSSSKRFGSFILTLIFVCIALLPTL